MDFVIESIEVCFVRVLRLFDDDVLISIVKLAILTTKVIYELMDASNVC